jgi:hypothetical protein
LPRDAGVELEEGGDAAQATASWHSKQRKLSMARRTSLSQKVSHLRAKTVARGATPAEAQVAAAKASELTQSEQRAEAEAILVKLN